MQEVTDEESSGKSEATYMTMVRNILGPAKPGIWRQEKELGRIWQTHGGCTLLGPLGRPLC